MGTMFPIGYGTGGYGQGGLIPQPSNAPSGGVPSISYYISLLTSQYKNSPNLLAWLAALLQPISDFATVIGQMAFPAFDLTWAVGAQLDILGQLVGTSRTVPFQPTGGGSPILDDPTFRILIKAKIAQNQWNGKIASLYPIWASLFPGGNIAIIDNQNMSATIILSGVFTSIVQDLINNGLIVPRPEGVMYTYEFPTLPVFGFSSGHPNAFVSGFDTGHWAG